MDAIITLKDEGNFVCTKLFVVIGINLEDQGSDVLILFDARSRFSDRGGISVCCLVFGDKSGFTVILFVRHLPIKLTSVDF